MAPFPLDPDAGAAMRWTAWRDAVGPPVALDLAPPIDGPVRILDVLSWNVAIGRGRLEEVLGRVGSSRPLVILLQEAYRVDEVVPEALRRRAHGGGLRAGERIDIRAVARACGLSLRYAPSMRSARSRSDRGCAILATVALEAARATELRALRQRRVAVAARVAGLPLTFVSAHLDTRARWTRTRRDQVTSLAALLEREAATDLVLGADLNSPWGARDPIVRQLARAGLHPALRDGRWRHTHHGAVRLTLDHVLYRSAQGHIGGVSVRRLDERPDGCGRLIFGSDHHPLLASLELSA
ncbi:MAG: endonuclease/exonuclease/phosphatase family protein [Gemmatimonadota bacterium]